ncbi:hypothetical protein LZ30DRAFT_443835 [Colletotrichum cereale]|nr:hypothetical protein LZ30DRAFT_443835 [Colletotrichum cereale]
MCTPPHNLTRWRRHGQDAQAYRTCLVSSLTNRTLPLIIIHLAVPARFFRTTSPRMSSVIVGVPWRNNNIQEPRPGKQGSDPPSQPSSPRLVFGSAGDCSSVPATVPLTRAGVTSKMSKMPRQSGLDMDYYSHPASAHPHPHPHPHPAPYRLSSVQSIPRLVRLFLKELKRKPVTGRFDGSRRRHFVASFQHAPLPPLRPQGREGEDG